MHFDSDSFIYNEQVCLSWTTRNSIVNVAVRLVPGVRYRRPGKLAACMQGGRNHKGGVNQDHSSPAKWEDKHAAVWTKSPIFSVDGR